MAKEYKKKEQTAMSKAIAERIRSLMEERGISAIKLAELMNVSIPTVYFHLKNNPTLEVLERIASILEVPTWDLLPIEPDYVPYSKRKDDLFSEKENKNAQIFTCPRCGQRFQLLSEEK